MAKTKGKGANADLAGKLIAGTAKHFASVTQFLLASGTFTPAQVQSELQSLVTLRSDTNGARSALEAKVAAETAQAPALTSFMHTYASFVQAAFSKSPDVLADFGLEPKATPTPLTVQQKAAAAAKREATRVARNTMGPKQKKAVKGNVVGVSITPVVAAAPVATVSSAPAPVAVTGAVSGTTPHGT